MRRGSTPTARGGGCPSSTRSSATSTTSRTGRTCWHRCCGAPGARQPHPAQPHARLQVDGERPQSGGGVRAAPAQRRRCCHRPRHPRTRDRRRLWAAGRGRRLTLSWELSGVAYVKYVHPDADTKSKSRVVRPMIRDRESWNAPVVARALMAIAGCGAVLGFGVSAYAADGPVAPVAQQGAVTPQANPDDVELEIFRLTNIARQTGRYCGSTWYPAAPPVRWDGRIARAARLHSQDMGAQNYFAHTNLAGQSYGDRITAQGFSWMRASENINAGYADATASVNAWIASPVHCEDLMDAQVTFMGLVMQRPRLRRTSGTSPRTSHDPPTGSRCSSRRMLRASSAAAPGTGPPQSPSPRPAGTGVRRPGLPVLAR